MDIVLLDGVIMHYPWGRNDFLAKLQRRNVPSAAPEAELWFGAHPNGASRVTGIDGCDTLGDVIETDPQRWLGQDVVATYGPQLPFLLKVLAVNEPLSLQLHPDETLVAALAADGDKSGLLADHHPKPEMIVALGELQALCGLREREDACQLVDDVVALSGSKAWLWVKAQIETGGVDAAVAALITAEASQIDGLLAALNTAVHTAALADRGPAIADLLTRYPNDRSVAIAVLMKLVVLADGEALYIPPGVLHCYLSGAGVEVMASSDNVLRVGLTQKPRHLAVVNRQLAASRQTAVLVRAERDGSVWRYPADTGWFSLIRQHATATGVPLKAAKHGPQLLLAVRGDLTVRQADGRDVTVRQGGGVFVAAGVNGVTLHGDADVFVAGLGA